MEKLYVDPVVLIISFAVMIIFALGIALASAWGSLAIADRVLDSFTINGTGAYAVLAIIAALLHSGLSGSSSASKSKS